MLITAINHNEKGTGIQLFFDEAPDSDTKSYLKHEIGFRPVRNNPLKWYAKRHPAYEQFASDLLDALAAGKPSTSVRLTESYEPSLASIDENKFSLIHVFYSVGNQLENVEFVIFDPYKKVATQIANDFANKRFGEDLKEVIVYPHTYKVRARQLLADGKIITRKAIDQAEDLTTPEPPEILTTDEKEIEEEGSKDQGHDLNKLQTHEANTGSAQSTQHTEITINQPEEREQNTEPQSSKTKAIWEYTLKDWLKKFPAHKNDSNYQDELRDEHYRAVLEAWLKGEVLREEVLDGYDDFSVDATKLDFDRVVFVNAAAFQELLDLIGINAEPLTGYNQYTEYDPAWLWRGENMELVTSSNPLQNKGVASYTCLIGKRDIALKAAQFIEAAGDNFASLGIQSIDPKSYYFVDPKHQPLVRFLFRKHGFKGLLTGQDIFDLRKSIDYLRSRDQQVKAFYMERYALNITEGENASEKPVLRSNQPESLLTEIMFSVAEERDVFRKELTSAILDTVSKFSYQFPDDQQKESFLKELITQLYIDTSIASDTSVLGYVDNYISEVLNLLPLDQTPVFEEIPVAPSTDLSLGYYLLLEGNGTYKIGTSCKKHFGDFLDLSIPIEKTGQAYETKQEATAAALGLLLYSVITFINNGDRTYPIEVDYRAKIKSVITVLIEFAKQMDVTPYLEDSHASMIDKMAKGTNSSKNLAVYQLAITPEIARQKEEISNTKAGILIARKNRYPKYVKASDAIAYIESGYLDHFQVDIKPFAFEGDYYEGLKATVYIINSMGKHKFEIEFEESPLSRVLSEYKTRLFDDTPAVKLLDLQLPLKGEPEDHWTIVFENQDKENQKISIAHLFVRLMKAYGHHEALEKQQKSEKDYQSLQPSSKTTKDQAERRIITNEEMADLFLAWHGAQKKAMPWVRIEVGELPSVFSEWLTVHHPSNESETSSIYPQLESLWLKSEAESMQQAKTVIEPCATIAATCQIFDAANRPPYQNTSEGLKHIEPGFSHSIKFSHPPFTHAGQHYQGFEARVEIINYDGILLWRMALEDTVDLARGYQVKVSGREEQVNLQHLVLPRAEKGFHEWKIQFDDQQLEGEVSLSLAWLRLLDHYEANGSEAKQMSPEADQIISTDEPEQSPVSSTPYQSVQGFSTGVIDSLVAFGNMSFEAAMNLLDQNHDLLYMIAIKKLKFHPKMMRGH